MKFSDFCCQFSVVNDAAVARWHDGAARLYPEDKTSLAAQRPVETATASDHIVGQMARVGYASSLSFHISNMRAPGYSATADYANIVKIYTLMKEKYWKST